jgi:hypothetical protein
VTFSRAALTGVDPKRSLGTAEQVGSWKGKLALSVQAGLQLGEIDSLSP